MEILRFFRDGVSRSASRKGLGTVAHYADRVMYSRHDRKALTGGREHSRATGSRVALARRDEGLDPSPPIANGPGERPVAGNRAMTLAPLPGYTDTETGHVG